ncbi:sulfotransferase domain-containing protein [Salipiger mucosus]|uniref:Sulfotransferase, putative n=1 Tax=Salipiger mucosus DSM 16094 TaxID=1123237 RepID=S9RRV5_9RHOB|nr:sulfotransferase domain-containing protein [Salipiger mucosus]EPX76684.1 sulfotransferase, putative [Salipiger mucosus DSM 16094]
MVHDIAPAATTYRGALTTPERWETWHPREGDILVCTPPKSGTTWTQTMLAMLLNGGPELPDTLGAISPWVDADLGVGADEVARTIAALPGRRVLKTHTPADGFPIRDGVTVVAVYRHPLDIFFSLRKHIANRHVDDTHPMKAPLPEALAAFLAAPMDRDAFDNDSLATIAHHYRQTACSGRVPGLVLMHYADMIRDPRATLRHLAERARIEAGAALVDAVARASDITRMRVRADRYAPVGGTGFWKDDAAFFATGGTGNWEGSLAEADLAAYRRRLAELVPDPDACRWLEEGTGKAL